MTGLPGSTLLRALGRGRRGKFQLGAPMHALRSRVGVVSVAAGAAVLLALPVVAAGQVPVVDQVVGGVKQTAESIAAAAGAPALPSLPAPPAQVQAPRARSEAAAPGAPRRTGAGRAGAGRLRPGRPAPVRAQPAAQCASSSGKAPHAATRNAAPLPRTRSRRQRSSAADTPARASQDELRQSRPRAAGVASAGCGPARGRQPGDAAVHRPAARADRRWPGLAALAGGLTLRRSARTARR